jgi:hypothetical protein
VSESAHGLVQLLVRLNRHVPMLGAVVAIADESLAFLGHHGVDRSHRHSPPGRDMDGGDLHGMGCAR